MRKPLIVLLGLGVLAGYGSALGHMRHRWHQGGYAQGDCGSRWGQRYEEAQTPVVTAPAPAPAPVPQAQPAPQPQYIPQIIIVQPQVVPAAPAPTVIVQPAAPAPAAVPAPAAKAEPQAKPQGQE